MPNGDANFHVLSFPQGVIPDPPERFTFPFHYRVHPLAQRSAEQLQDHLLNQEVWHHDFGFDSQEVGARGKMFGVLVVRGNGGQLGYLAGYSGKLANSNHLPGFVPPVYDTLLSQGFYKQGEKRLVKVNAEVKRLEQSIELRNAREQLTLTQEQAKEDLSREKKELKAAKVARRRIREEQKLLLNTEEYAKLEKSLAQESVGRHFALKDLTTMWKSRVDKAEKALSEITQRINRLKDFRKSYSNYLQHRIFRQYQFLDAGGALRDLPSIFEHTIFKTPPAGAGECAAPKLLQYAYQQGYEPVCMAEFWWGQAPSSEIRRHGHYYPACRGKCEPILGHMLQGLEVDPNPMLENPAVGKTLDIVYEDEAILVVNKPHDFLSVPGKNIEDSVWLRIRQQYPEATGPLIVHRLDMSTSGLLLLAKKKEVHKRLQHQFFKRSVKKRYVALLDGEVKGASGTIDLPLRLDIEDRPRQIVCHEDGKTARTHWEVVERLGGKTRVHLWPVTGRTHQLRVHSAHPHGLNASMIGDDLYGQAGERLHLHAEEISFVHPVTREEVHFEVKAGF